MNVNCNQKKQDKHHANNVNSKGDKNVNGGAKNQIQMYNDKEDAYINKGIERTKIDYLINTDRLLG